MNPSVSGFDPSTGELLGHDLTSAELERMLPHLLELRRQRDELDRAYKTASAPVRAYLEGHPGEELRDGETGIVARLQERQGADELDAMSLAEKAPHLVVWLASKGGLRLDAAAWKSLAGKAAETVDIQPFVMPGRGTTALIIEKAS